MGPRSRVFAVLVVSWGPALGCATSAVSDAAANAPCTRSRDCAGDLVCLDGVCAHPSDAAAEFDGDAAVLDGD